MRLVALMLMLGITSGCVGTQAGAAVERYRLAYRSDTHPAEQLEKDLAACTGLVSTGHGPVAIFMAALLLPTEIILHEVERDCMATKGWELGYGLPPTPTEPERAVLH